MWQELISYSPAHIYMTYALYAWLCWNDGLSFVGRQQHLACFVTSQIVVSSKYDVITECLWCHHIVLSYCNNTAGIILCVSMTDWSLIHIIPYELYIMDVQHYGCQMFCAQFRQSDSSEAWFIGAIHNLWNFSSWTTVAWFEQLWNTVGWSHQSKYLNCSI